MREPAVPHVAAIPQVRQWMKKVQRECAQFGNLVMEGRDIGTNVFPESEYKFYLDACLKERSKRRAADGVQENLAARDQRDSQRASAPLMVALGAMIVNTSEMTAQQSSEKILAEISMGSSLYSTPIVANGVLFVSTKNQLFAIEAPKK